MLSCWTKVTISHLKWVEERQERRWKLCNNWQECNSIRFFPIIAWSEGIKSKGMFVIKAIQYCFKMNYQMQGMAVFLNYCPAHLKSPGQAKFFGNLSINEEIQLKLRSVRNKDHPVYNVHQWHFEQTGRKMVLIHHNFSSHYSHNKTLRRNDTILS